MLHEVADAVAAVEVGDDAEQCRNTSAIGNSRPSHKQPAGQRIDWFRQCCIPLRSIALVFSTEADGTCPLVEG